MTSLPSPNNDRLKGLPVNGLPASMTPPKISIGSSNEYLKKNDPDFAKLLETNFLNTKLFDIKNVDKNAKEEKNYISSDYRIDKYKSAIQSDSDFSIYLKNLYGSVSNYFDMNEDLVKDKTYNPRTDYNAEVVIITKDNYYKSTFISKNETILEMLNGVCTVEYFQRDGRISRLNTTLSSKFIPQSQRETRLTAFGGLPGNRLLCWDLVKQKWASFYMSGLKRFVRDETSGLE